MAAPIRWLHLSDFHTGKDEHGQQRVAKSILDHVQKRVAQGLAPDLVFLSGDIANYGLPAEYQDFADGFFFPLIDMMGSEAVSRTFVVPGNHDVDRRKARAAFRYDVLDDVPEFFDPTPQGLAEREQYYARFHAFDDNDLTGLREAGSWLKSEAGTRTMVRQVHGRSVGVACINTAWLCNSDKDRNRLLAGKALVQPALEQIEGCDLRIVLGHHPIDWLADEEARVLRTLFGRAGVLYLHGHLHQNEGANVEGGGNKFLALQSGAVFQAREDERWVNRFLWAEADLDTSELHIEPLQWSRDQQEWVVDTNAFPTTYRSPSRRDHYVFSLPATQAAATEPAPNKAVLTVDASPTGLRERLGNVEGWLLVDHDFLARGRSALSEEELLLFFDGRVPEWKEALAPEIPRRSIVNDIVEQLGKANEEGRTTIVQVKGPGGEGKSTAIRQAVAAMAEEGWHVFWHNHAELPLPEGWLPPPSDGPWVIVSDDADLIANNIYETVKEVRKQNRRDVQFLLCCRDTDWIAARADSLDWHRYAELIEMPLRGLTSEDARKIVAAWARLGLKGLGRLENLDPEAAAEQLFAAARDDSANQQEGAFLGAMLRTRFGRDLNQHVKVLLGRLNGQSTPGYAETLMEAFAYIAVPHAENVLTLSTPILEEALGCTLRQVKREILRPLGEEAAAVRQGSYILTRHRAIAEAAVSVLSGTYKIDAEDILADLAAAAIKASVKGPLPNVEDWRGLPSRLFAQGRVELALWLARNQVDAEPSNPYRLVTYSRLLREAGYPDDSVDLFRSHPNGFRHRAFYSEWAVAEGNLDNDATAASLRGISLSDEIERIPIDNNGAKIRLSGASLAFGRCFSKYGDRAFIEASGATAQLGLRLILDPETKRLLLLNQQNAIRQGVEVMDPATALARLEEGFRLAWQQREIDLPPWVRSPEECTYSRLARLLGIEPTSG